MDSHIVSPTDSHSRKWGWMMALGIVLTILGVISILYAWLATVASMMVFGWLLIAGGISYGIEAFSTRGWRGTLLHILAGVLQVVVGVLVVMSPVRMAAGLTLIFAAWLLVDGLFRIIGALSLRIHKAGWAVAAGLFSCLLGIALLLQWPVSSLWFIGVFVGIELILEGALWTSIALSVRNGEIGVIESPRRSEEPPSSEMDQRRAA